MPSSGKIVRLNRFFAASSRTAVIVPCDHGLTVGPIDGLENVDAIARWIRTPGITGVIGHKGMIEKLASRQLLDGLGVMVHLNGTIAHSAEANRKELLTQMETALRLGADAVSVQLNFDGSNDAYNLKLLGRVVDDALRFDVPVMPMLYDVAPTAKTEERVSRLSHLMRVALELGADAVKIGPPESLADLKPLLSTISRDMPVFLAGGACGDKRRLLELLRESLHWGGRGLCVGRNLFQCDTPQTLLRDIYDVINLAPRERASALTVLPSAGFLEATQ